MRHSLKKGFTLMELIVVIAILSILAGVLAPRVSNHLASARDARRLADIKTVRLAIEQYYADKGKYPPPNKNQNYGGWDVSHDGNFIRVLRNEGYLDQDVEDPINDETYHYRYYVYPKGSYGCFGSTPFYVLGILHFETPEFAAKNKGFFRCKDRNWGSEFDYVTGGGASYKK